MYVIGALIASDFFLYLTVLTANIGKPEVVLNAGRSILPKSSARVNNIGSPDRAYADNSPPRYRITVSKKGANWD